MKTHSIPIIRAIPDIIRHPVTVCIFFMLLLAMLLPLASKGEEKVGLVLSGGGAKGIAHVGVIKALEDNDIPVDYVTGTSMGAIVGSLYCCGWSPEEMMKFFTSKDFGYWSTGKINPANIYYINKKQDLPNWVGFNLNFNDSDAIPNQIIPTSLINPIPMNIEFLRLYAPYTQQCKGDFNNLMVPFRCVFSDVYGKHKVVCSKGSLGESVRGSMSFPLVFKPIHVDGILAFDGGIYDNFPVNVMEQDFNPDFIIGVSVSGPDGKPQTDNIYSELEDMIIQNNDYSVPADKGIKIQVPVLDFGVLDFNKATTIYDIGYRTGLAMVDSIKSRISQRRPLEEVSQRRKSFAEATPQVIFDSVKVEGAKPTQEHFLTYLFENGDHPFGMQHIEEAYYQAVGEDKINDLLPEAIFNFKNPSKNKLLLKTDVKKPWGFGVGGWITSSTNSFLFVNAGYHTLSYNSLDVDLGAWIGQSYLATQLSARFALRSHRPSFMTFDFVASRQKYYDTNLLFYQTKTPAFITERQLFGQIGFAMAVGHHGIFKNSVAFGHIADSYYPDNKGDFSTKDKDKTSTNSLTIKSGLDFNTLNDQMFPSAGNRLQIELRGSRDNFRFFPTANESERRQSENRFSLALKADFQHYIPIIKHFTLGYRLMGMATLQKAGLDYTATLIRSEEFAPLHSIRNYFYPDLRSDNYIAAGLVPIYSPVSNLQVRGDFFVYSKLRGIVPDNNGYASYDGWLKRPEFIGQVSVLYNFPFASVSAYVNYLTVNGNRWNAGITLGLDFHALKLH